jgi:hypothetical protein
MTAYVNGYSVSPHRDAIGIRTYQAAPGVLLPVRASVAPLLIGAAKDFHHHVERLHPGWCWGYAFRAITGGSGYSWHSAGIAVDLNAPVHPYGKGGTFTPMQRYLVRAIAKKYGLRTGIDYRTNPDEMHLEVIITPAQARERVAQLKRRDSPILPFPGDLKEGDEGFSVRVLQRALNRRPLDHDVKVDGKFGPRTKELVVQFKHRQNLHSPENGIVGFGAWNALF